MSFESRRTEAVAILERTGMWQSNYAPPALRLAWRLGLKVPPPHFARFWSIVAFYAAWFAIGWGTLMWLAVWSVDDGGVAIAIVTSVVAGVVFGLLMAAYYAYGRHKHSLPTWQSLGEPQVHP